MHLHHCHYTVVYINESLNMTQECMHLKLQGSYVALGGKNMGCQSCLMIQTIASHNIKLHAIASSSHRGVVGDETIMQEPVYVMTNRGAWGH